VVEVPVSVLLPSIPETVLLSSASEILASALAEENFRLPLATILPMLPSGKIELTIGDLVTGAPEGIFHTVEALGEWTAQPVLLPLPPIVMRISPEMMSLRRDQKQIDTMILTMDDPFSPEALRAKAEAARAAAESAAAAAVVPEPPAEVEDIPAVVEDAEPSPPAVSSFSLNTPAAEPIAPELATTTYIPEPQFADLPEPEPAADVAEEETAPATESLAATHDDNSSAPPKEPDFSFTQSAEYQALLAKLNQAEEPAEFSAPPAPAPKEPSSKDAPEVAPPELEPVAPASAKNSFSFTPPPIQITPTRRTQPPPDSETEVVRSPLTAAVEASKPGLGATFSKALGEISKTAPAAASPEAGFRAEPAAPPSVMRSLLKIPSGSSAEIKDVIHHIGLWPGVDACVICGLDGLPITSFVAEGKTSPPISAVAPKLLKTLSTLFTDLGRVAPEEFTVPSESDTLHFFKHQDMILILSYAEPQLPAVYRKTVKQALALLSTGTSKS
jgi:predicted regulator of Ras-like GTPase activity (Roadblock/LC7/MglB family)